MKRRAKSSDKTRSKKDIFAKKKLQLHHMFSKWIDAVNELVKNGAPWYEINNKLCDIRNLSCEFFDAVQTEITVSEVYKTDIRVPVRETKSYRVKSYGSPCDICGEKRVYNLCHVIPRSEGGSDDKGNILILCPTHHFLFDHARLTKSEFGSINRSHLLPEANDYLNLVHFKRHEMRWRYQTNRFKGCKCGSKEFRFDVKRDEVSVFIVLHCLKCGSDWLNVWENDHPLNKLRALAMDAPKGTTTKQFLDKAEKKARLFLKNKLDDLLKK